MVIRQIKVRLQTQPMPKPGEAPQFKGVIDCAAKTIRHEGVTTTHQRIRSPRRPILKLYVCACCYAGARIVQGDGEPTYGCASNLRCGLRRLRQHQTVFLLFLYSSQSLARAYPTYGVLASRLMGETADTPLAINKIALAGAITGLATVVRDTAQVDLVVCCSPFCPSRFAGVCSTRRGDQGAAAGAIFIRRLGPLLGSGGLCQANVPSTYYLTGDDPGGNQQLRPNFCVTAPGCRQVVFGACLRALPSQRIETYLGIHYCTFRESTRHYWF